MDKLGIVFFCAWLLVGCSLDAAVDNPKNMIVTVIATIVAVACVWAMSRRDGDD